MSWDGKWTASWWHTFFVWVAEGDDGVIFCDIFLLGYLLGYCLVMFDDDGGGGGGDDDDDDDDACKLDSDSSFRCLMQGNVFPPRVFPSWHAAMLDPTTANMFILHQIVACTWCKNGYVVRGRMVDWRTWKCLEEIVFLLPICSQQIGISSIS